MSFAIKIAGVGRFLAFVFIIPVALSAVAHAQEESQTSEDKSRSAMALTHAAEIQAIQHQLRELNVLSERLKVRLQNLVQEAQSPAFVTESQPSEAEPLQQAEGEDAHPPEGEDPVEVYRTALKSLSAGDYAESQRLFSEFLDSHSKHRLAPNVYYWLAVLASYGGAIDSAQQYLSALLSTYAYPEHYIALDALYFSAELNVLADRTQRAVEILKKLLEIAPDTSVALRAQKLLDELYLMGERAGQTNAE